MTRARKRLQLRNNSTAEPSRRSLLVLTVLILQVAILSQGLASGSPESGVRLSDRCDPRTRQLLDRFWIVPVDSLSATPDVGQYLGFALNHNPEIAAAFYNWQAVLAGVDLAGAWPEPTVGFGEYLVPVETKVGPQQRSFSLRQNIPWFGVTGLQTEKVHHQAEAQRTEQEAVLLTVISEVRRLHAELGYLGRSLELTRQNVEILDQWAQVAQARYETGSGDYEQLILAQVERDRLGVRLEQHDDRRQTLAAAFNAVCGRDINAPVPLPDLFSAPELNLNSKLLAEQLLIGNPTLRGLAHLRDSRLSGERLAARAAYPSLSLGLDYIQTGATENPALPDNGKDPVIARFSFKLPLWGQYGARKQQAASHRLTAEQQLRTAQARLQAQLAELMSGHREAWRNYVLYGENLLTKGRQSLAAVEAAFRAGRLGFRDLIDEQMTQLAFELAYQRAGTDCLIKQAAIESLLAVPVGPLLVTRHARCPVMGGAIDTAEFVDYQGRRIFFCCQGCDVDFLTNPTRYLTKLEQEGSL